MLATPLARHSGLLTQDRLRAEFWGHSPIDGAVTLPLEVLWPARW